MKKFLFLGMALAVAAASPSFAQTTTSAGTTTHLPTHRVMRMHTPEQSAQRHTAKLTKKLSLSAEQQAKVQPILLAQAQEAQALKAKYPAATQHQALHQEMKATHAKYQAQLQGVLSADQYAKLSAMQQEHHAKGAHGGKMKTKS